MDQGHGHRSAHDLALMILRIAVLAEYPYKLSPRSYPTWATEKDRQQKVSLVLGYDV